MLTVDNFLKPVLVYDAKAAPVLPLDDMPAKLAPMLEYQARHMVLASFVVGKIMDLKPRRTGSFAPANNDARILDTVTSFVQHPAFSQESDLLQALRQRADASLKQQSWTHFMVGESKRALLLTYRAPKLAAQPIASRAWLEGVLMKAQQTKMQLRRRG